MHIRRVAQLRRPAERSHRRGRLHPHVVDPDYDDGGEPITLAIFGKVPPGLADQLPF